ncbi:MAG: ABC transporter permease [Nitrososphaerales archaeon]|jgi:ABC-2 type transport system permease protein
MTMDPTNEADELTRTVTTQEQLPAQTVGTEGFRQRPKLDTSPLHGLWALTNRDLRKWYKNRIQLLISLVQPIVWLGIFGKALNFGSIISQAGAGGNASATIEKIFGTSSYFSFLSVGMLAMIILFTAAFSGMSVVFDRRFGFLNKALSTPVSRGAIVLSKILQSGIRALVQAGIVLVIAVALGMDVSHFTVVDIFEAFVLLFLMAFALSALFVSLALRSSDWQTQMAIINLLNLPLIFASNALFPVSIMPQWLQDVVKLNPVSYAIDGARQLLLGATGTYSVALDFAVIGGFAVVIAGLGIVASWKLLQK